MNFCGIKLGIGRGHLKSPQRREIDPQKIQDAFALVGTARKYTGVLKNGCRGGGQRVERKKIDCSDVVMIATVLGWIRG